VETVSTDVEALSKLGESLDSFGGKIADLMRHAANFDLEQAYFERAYRPDVVERTAKVEVQIDRQIEKAIARLANIKEFKRIYAPRNRGRKTRRWDQSAVSTKQRCARAIDFAQSTNLIIVQLNGGCAGDHFAAQDPAAYNP